MKHIVYIVGFLLTTNPIVSQSFINETKLWSNVKYGTEYGHPYESFYIKMIGDTTITDVQYTKVHRSNDSLHLNWTLEGFIRETDTGTVYYREYDEVFETLLYDYGVVLNDSIEVIGGAVNYFYVDSIIFKPYGLFNETRKYIYLTDDHKVFHERWIEGIGSIYGVLSDLSYIGSVGEYRALLCFSENDSLKYLSGYFNTCFKTGIHTLSGSQPYLRKIEVKQSREELTFKVGTSSSYQTHIRIFDLNGRLLLSKKYSSRDSFTLSTSEFKKGMYIYLIRNLSFIKSGKFIVD